MSTGSIVNRAKLEAWASHFAEQKASGLTVADWCQAEQNIKEQLFLLETQAKG